MSTHRSALTLARCFVAAHCASLRVLATLALRAFDGQRPGRERIFPFRTVPQFSMVVPLRSQARLWHSLLHWAYSALFRAQRARASCAPALRLRGVPCLRTALAFGGAVFRHCGRPLGVSSRLQPLSRPSIAHLRFASCARHFSPSGLHLFASVCIHSSQSSICIARKLACSSRCSLGSLRPVSATGGGLRAPRKKYQK